MEVSVLDKISPIGHFNYSYDGWRNGKIGSISNVNGDCIYRFIEADRDDNGHLYTQPTLQCCTTETPNEQIHRVFPQASRGVHYRRVCKNLRLCEHPLGAKDTGQVD